MKRECFEPAVSFIAKKVSFIEKEGVPDRRSGTPSLCVGVVYVGNENHFIVSGVRMIVVCGSCFCLILLIFLLDAPPIVVANRQETCGCWRMA